MAEQDDTVLPAGVAIADESSSQVAYRGSESALLAAGIIQAEWIEGLGRLSRQIAINPSGGFSILGEGKGARITHAHRQHGAFTVKRLADGDIVARKYRTIAEEREREAAMIEEMGRERERADWNQAKAARIGQDYPSQWKSAVISHFEVAIELLEGKRLFQGFPEIKLSSPDLEKVQRAAVQLRAAIEETAPRLNDLQPDGSNVIRLHGRAYRAMT